LELHNLSQQKQKKKVTRLFIYNTLIVINPHKGHRFYLPRSLDIEQYEINDLVPAPTESGKEIPLIEKGDFWTNQRSGI